MQKEVSMFRLNLMRSLYLLICVGLGSERWPLMFHHKPWGPDAWRCVQPACMRKLLTILNTMVRTQQHWCVDRAAGALVSA